MIVNVSKGKSYLSQRDNVIRPAETCCPTSLVMALMYSGVSLPNVSGQPEDSLTRFTEEDPYVQAFYQRIAPDFYKEGIPANEVHSVMEYAVNRWIGKTAVMFSTSTPLLLLFNDLVYGRASAVSGVWNGLRHVTTLVGFETSQEDFYVAADAADIGSPRVIMVDLTLIRTVFIDDPYGRYQLKYSDRNGDDVAVPFQDYVSNTRERGSLVSKWAYRVIS